MWLDYLSGFFNNNKSVSVLVSSPFSLSHTHTHKSKEREKERKGGRAEHKRSGCFKIWRMSCFGRVPLYGAHTSRFNTSCSHGANASTGV